MEKIIKQLLLNKKERNALLIIMFMLIISYIYLLTKEKSILDEPPKTFEKILLSEGISEEEIKIKSKKIDSLIHQSQKKSPYKSNYKKKSTTQKKEKFEKKFTNKKAIYKVFDPHNVDSTTLCNMLIPPYVFSNLKNYRNKGGKFYEPEDLKKIYGLKEEDYNRIKSHCKIKPQSKTAESPIAKTKIKKALININEADTTQLKKLYGIGSKLAARIIKYRKNIGGFHSIQQLTEVYGVNPEVLTDNEKKIIVSGQLSKININAITYESLQKHYYFDRKVAKILTNYRTKHGDFEKISDLKKIKVLSDSLYNKIEPYCVI